MRVRLFLIFQRIVVIYIFIVLSDRKKSLDKYICFLIPERDSNILEYQINQEYKKLDLTPYLDDIFANAKKDKDYNYEGTKPYILENETGRFVFESLEGEKESNGKIKLRNYVGGYLLLK